MTHVARPSRFNWRRFAFVAGPGMVVMLADTDAGSLITAAQIGAQWGYRLLPLQVALMPILKYGVRDARWFYGAYAAALILGATIVASGANLVALSIAVQVMNALLPPIVVGFLFLLARRLPEPYRLKGVYGLAATAATGIAVAFGVFSGMVGLFA